jgi:tartrate dehydrogenase/decarboxylase/D-malate dehydrogenase
VTNRYRIAVIPGDGIGKETIPEGLKVLRAVASVERLQLEFETFPWGAERFMQTGEFMPADGLATLTRFDAIYFGAVGHPDVDDSLPGIHVTFRIRKAFQQYANLRPVRLLPGVRGPLRDKGPEDIDCAVVRENTEGEFAEVGGTLNADLPEGLAIQTGVFTRSGVARIADYAFRLARSRRGRVTNVTKSNALTHGLVFWDRVIDDVRQGYPDVAYGKMYVDAAAMNMVLRPERFDVIVTTNMFGDILSDLGGALMGGLGLAPSANINPERRFPSMFEPIHGSAPDIAGQGIANPLGTIWAGALMLEHLGETSASRRIVDGIAALLQDTRAPRTADLGGQAGTAEVGDAMAERLAG